MTKVIAKMNLYDILAMIVPGGAWLLVGVTFGNMTKLIHPTHWPWVQTIEKAGSEVSVEICIAFVLLIVAYVIGLAQHTIINAIMRKRSSKKKNSLSNTVKEILGNEKPAVKEKTPKDMSTAELFYYVRRIALTDDGNETILTIEYQCALLRGLFVPLILLAFLSSQCWCCGVLGGIIIGVAMWYLLEYRLHHLARTIIRHYKAALEDAPKEEIPIK